MAFITVITGIVHAMTSRDFRGWGQGGANLLPPFILLVLRLKKTFWQDMLVLKHGVIAGCREVEPVFSTRSFIFGRRFGEKSHVK